jgi:hypothetical protein
MLGWFFDVNFNIQLGLGKISSIPISTLRELRSSVPTSVSCLLDECTVEPPTFQRAELDLTQRNIADGMRGVPNTLLWSIYPTSSYSQAIEIQQGRKQDNEIVLE